MVRHIIQRGRRRAEKLLVISHEDLVMTSISQVLFAFGLTLLVIYGWASAFLDLHPLTKTLYGIGIIFAFVFSYLAFERAKSVDFLDFIAGMLFTGVLRTHPRGRFVDSAAAQLYLGLVFVSAAPLLLHFLGTSQAAASAALGGILMAVGVATYVLSGRTS